MTVSYSTRSKLTCNINSSQSIDFVKVNKREIYVAPDIEQYKH